MEVLRFPFALKQQPTEAGEFAGYGSVFGNTDAYGDVVMPGAFIASLADYRRQKAMPPLLWQHDPGFLCGDWLDMAEDSYGLKCQGKLWVDGPSPDPHAQKAYRALRGTIGAFGLSIGFSTEKYEIDDTQKGERARKLTQLKLWEVSLVTFPANDAARVTSVRSGPAKSVREFEQTLRAIGYSRAQATAIAREGFRGVDARDEPAPPVRAPEPRDEDGSASTALLRAIRAQRAQLSTAA